MVQHVQLWQQIDSYYVVRALLVLNTVAVPQVLNQKNGLLYCHTISEELSRGLSEDYVQLAVQLALAPLKPNLICLIIDTRLSDS